MQYLLSPEEYEKLRSEKEEFEQAVTRECNLRLGEWYGSVAGQLSGLRADLMSGREACDLFRNIVTKTKP